MKNSSELLTSSLLKQLYRLVVRLLKTQTRNKIGRYRLWRSQSLQKKLPVSRLIRSSTTSQIPFLKKARVKVP